MGALPVTKGDLRMLPKPIFHVLNAMMNNDCVVGAYCTSHWLTVIIYMKFKEVWYLDSAKQHPPLKFPDLQTVLNWSVFCRFCLQKFNLLVFLIGFADHAGPLVQYFFVHKNLIS
jgi:hypothetical protein